MKPALISLRFNFIVAFFLLLLLNMPSYGQDNVPKVSMIKGKGLQILAPDSSGLVKFNFRIQNLMTSEKKVNSDTPWDTDFMIRRARLKFGGWAVDPRLSYKIELGLSNRDLGSSSDYVESNQAPKVILDAVVKYQFTGRWSVWFGQTKLPGNRERVISSQALQFVDRSAVNSIFNIDREMGIHLRGKYKFAKSVIKPIFSWSLGEGRNITKDNIGGYNYTARLEWLPFGEFSSKGDYFASDLNRESNPKLAFGATLNHNDGASRQKQSGKFLVDEEGNYFNHQLQTLFFDWIFKYDGWSFTGEFANKKMVDNMIEPVDAGVRAEVIDANGRSYYTGKGMNMQLAYLFKNNFEIGTRFTTVIPDSGVSFKQVDEYTIGLSKYIVGHSIKVQSDFSYLDYEGTDKVRFRFQMEFGF